MTLTLSTLGRKNQEKYRHQNVNERAQKVSHHLSRFPRTEVDHLDFRYSDVSQGRVQSNYALTQPSFFRL
jgi:hypothetical protein